MTVFDELSEAHVDNLSLGVVVQSLLLENRRLVGVLADVPAALQELRGERDRARDLAAKLEAQLALVTESADATEDPDISYDDDGTLDEFLGHGHMHLERMDKCAWWIRFSLPDGRAWHINVGSVTGRAKGYANCEEE